MSRLINAYGYLICRKCKKEWKALLVALLIGFFFLVILSHLLVMYCASKSWFSKIVLGYSTYFIIYIALTIFPISIFKNFIDNKEYDRFLLLGISLPTCFFWIYFREIFKILFGTIISMFVLMPSLQFCHIAYLHLGKSIFIFMLTLYNIQIFFQLLQYIIVGEALYKINLFTIGCTEIFSFFFFQAIIKHTTIITLNLLTLPLVNVYILIFNIFIIMIGLFIYNKIYFYKGFSFSTLKNAHTRTSHKFNISKDCKLFIRDFDRIKFILVTFLIYFFSSIIGVQNVEGTVAGNIFILCWTFYFFIGLQLMIDCIRVDKNKREIYIMADINWIFFINEKKQFALKLLLIIGLLYDVIVFIHYHISYKYSIVFLIETVFFIFNFLNILGKYLAPLLLSDFMFTWSNISYYLKNISKMIIGIITLFIVVIGINQIQISTLTTVILFFILECLLLIVNKLFDKTNIKFSEKIFLN